MYRNNQPVFYDRQGKTTPEAPQTSFRGNVFAMINTNRRNGASISAETCIPHWDGEPMDSGMVIAKLVELDNSN